LQLQPVVAHHFSLLLSIKLIRIMAATSFCLEPFGEG